VSWIDKFLEYAAPVPTPDLFRLWAGISAIAGVLERRVWTAVIPGKPIFPNMYNLLVANPGIGKSIIIEEVRDLWNAIERPGFGRLFIAPEGVTKAAILDALDESKRIVMVANGSGILHPFEYNSLNIAASEFGVLVPSHDLEFMNVMNHIYDNPPVMRDRTRTSKSVAINKPQINMIAGTQPGYLASLLPEEAWSMGFMSRVVMLYAGAGPDQRLFEGKGLDAGLKAELLRELLHMTTLHGYLDWEPDAQRELVEWYAGKMPPTPEHSKLQHYCSRRLITTCKVAMIYAIAGGEAAISLDAFRAGRAAVLQAELAMPDVFREMVKRSDGEVIKEMHYFLWKLWLKNKKPLHESMLVHFLSARVPSEKVIRVIEIAARANVIQLAPGENRLWIPMPSDQFGGIE